MTRRTKSISKDIKLTPEMRVKLKGRIKTIRETIKRMEAMPPALGRKWQEGMLQYYRRILAELESYAANTGKPE